MDAQSQQDELVSYWFSKEPKEWFMPPAGLDDEIRSKYLDLIRQARAGKLDDWQSTPKGVLCLVLLLDQFPRNVFRGSGESFSSDVKAREMMTRAVAKGFDKELGKVSQLQQTVCYLPFIHAEDLLAQVAGQALFDSLAKSVDEGSEGAEFMQSSVAFSKRHMDCVALLGRFPMRNEPLGRQTTDQEKKFLEKNPDGF